MAFSEYTGEVLPYSFEDRAIDKILALEGGFNAKDAVTGMPVKYGIDQRANPDIDVSKLTKEDAAQIYRDKYWKASGADKLPEDLALVHFDAAVNQGSMAQKFLEQSGGDVNKYLELRKQHYDELARTNPSKYGSSHKGWMNRLNDIAATAYDLQQDNNFQEYDGELLPLEGIKKDGVVAKTAEGVADVGKLLGAGAVKGVAGAPEAIETAAGETAKSVLTKPSETLNLLADPRALTDKIASTFGFKKPEKVEGGIEIIPQKTIEKQDIALQETLTKGKITPLRELTEIGNEASKALESSVSPEMREAMANSTPTGNLIEAVKTGDFSEISFGKDVSAKGLIGQTAKVFGSTAPAILTGIITKSPTIGGAVGFGQGASEGIDNAREHIAKMSDEELSKNSEYFSNLLVLGYDPKVAREMTIDKAAGTAALAQGVVASLGADFTVKLLTGKLDKVLLENARNKLGLAMSSKAAKIAGGTAVGAAEEGIQELMEGVASDLGIDKTVVREIGQDSFANLVLGAIGGGGPGGVRGAISKEGKPEAKAEPEVREEPKFREVVDEEIVPFTEEEKAQAEFAGAQEIEVIGVGQAPGTQDIEASLAELEGTPIVKAPVAEPVAEEVVEKPVTVVEEKVEEAPVAEFAKAVNVKDFSPEDKKLIRSMEVEKNKIGREKKLFPAFLRKHGVQPSEKADLGLEGVSAPNIWKVAAPTFDELTSRAISEGFLMPTGDDVQDVENFRQYVKDYIGSGIISTGPDVAREGQLRAIDDSIQEIIRKYETPREEFGLEKPTPADLRAQEEATKAREAEAARIEAEDQARRDREEIARLSQESDFALGKTAAEDLMGQKSVFEQPEEEKVAYTPPKLYQDNPGGDWLKGKKEQSIEAGKNKFGSPSRFGSVTGSFRGRTVLVPVNVLARLKGINAEQENVREKDLEAIKKIMDETGRLPQHDGVDYAPFINVYQDGTAYVNEGNHRIMAAKALGFKYLPVEISYFNGGEQIKTGDLPPKDAINYDMQANDDKITLDNYRGEKKPRDFGKEAYPFAKTEVDIDAEMARKAEEGRAEIERRKEAGGEDADIPFFNIERKQTSTQAFKKWFKNSQIIDDNGNPKVLYHATAKDFNTFVPGGIPEKGRNLDSGEAVWLGANPEYQPAMHNISGREGKFREGTNVMPVYVSSQTPLILDDEDMLRWARDVFANGSMEFPHLMPKKWVDAVKDAGYDSIVYDDPNKTGDINNVEYIVFEPNQIKSAIGNRGTFSTEEGNITLDIGKERKIINDRNQEIRDEKIREMQGLAQRKAAAERRFVKDKSKKGDMFNFKVLSEQIDVLQQEIDDLKEEDRRPEAWLKRAGEAIADKKNPISQDVYDVIQTIYKKNPQLLEGLKLSITALPGEKNAAGEFKHLERIVKLYKDTSGMEDPSTLRHELTHSLEQMMKKPAKKALAAKWGEEFKRAYLAEKTTEGKEFFQAVIDMLGNPSTEAFNKAVEKMPTLPDGSQDYKYYQYLSPSEYWAVNAEPLMQAYLGGGWQKFKNFVKGLFETVKDLFGVRNNRIFYNTFNQVINGPRIGYTMLNHYVTGSIPALNVNRNYLGGQPPLTTWAEPDSSIITDITYTLADKNIDLKNVQKSIIKEIGQIEDRFDAYMKEELYHGRSAKRIEDFLKQELLPIIKDLNKYGISIQQFDEFLHNRHAEERNNQINKVNPDLTLRDQGSGIKTEDARAYLDGLDAKDFAAMDRLASKIDAMVQGTQKILVTNGLEEQSTIDAWNGAYKHYVPLNRLDLDFAHDVTGMGQGISTRGGTTKRATGSLKEVADIFSNIAMQRERAIIRSEKARVGRAVYGLALKNPNTDFWLPVNPDAIKDPEGLARELESLGLTAADAKNFIKEPVTSDIDKDTGLVVNRINVNNRFSDNVLPIRVNGKDRFIFFNANNPEALRLVKSLKNMDAEQLGLVLGLVGKVTRWIAAVNTQYNPVFGAWNFTRDVGSAMLNLSTTPIADQKAKVLGNVFPAYWGIYSDLRSERKKQTPAEGKWADLWERYQLAGGQTGFRDQFAQSRQNKYQLEDSTKKTAKLVGDRAANWIASHRKSANIIEREMAALNRGNVSKLTHAVFDLLSDYNDAMENAVRLSAFKAALDKGLSEERAASIAKNLTVNFNRKGQASVTMGALYAFFNAAVQGTMRIGETLSGPAGRKIIAGGLILGVGQALMLSMAGFDDDEPPEFLKDKNLIIPTGDGGYSIIPMPLGFSAIPGFGRRVTEMVMNGDKIPSRVLGIFGMMADAFNPLGTGSFAQMLSPTAADPFVSVSMNKDPFGRPIYKEDRNTNPTPGYSRSREGASTLAKYLAEFINYSSGGTAYQKGYFSPTADELDYLAGQLTGGAGREVQKAAETAKGLVTGEEVPAHRKPITGKIFGNINSPEAISSKFYRNITTMAGFEQEVKGRIENDEDADAFLETSPEASMWRFANRQENKVNKINKQITQNLRIQNNSNSSESDIADAKESIKDLKERRTEIMNEFNERFKEEKGR